MNIFQRIRHKIYHKFENTWNKYVHRKYDNENNLSGYFRDDEYETNRKAGSFQAISFMDQNPGCKRNLCDDAKMVRKHLIFYGRVQNVGFRYEAVMAARRIGLTGWVRNLEDGSVEMEVQGMEEQIAEIKRYLDSIPRIRISDIAEMIISIDLEEKTFNEMWTT